MKELSIYIHIPFCVRKCRYCDFLSFPVCEEERESYVNLLMEEIELRAGAFTEDCVVSIFFGGGTPSLLSGRQMTRILDGVKNNYRVAEDAEITMEMNPGTVNEEKLKAYYEAGINRISIGLQTTNNRELQTIGRIYTYEDFLQTYKMARETGFHNVNIDLMSALPGQTMDTYRETLDRVLALQPEHISAYSLILEEGTELFEHSNEYHFPDEDTDRDMYLMTGEMLGANGYRRYEISNYAKKGYECLHNKVYWKRGNYLGLGLGASSMIDNSRFKNPESMETYGRMVERLKVLKIDGIDNKIRRNENEIRPCNKEQNGGHCGQLNCRQKLMQQLQVTETEYQKLTKAEQMEEFMFLGLRLTEGVSRTEFAQLFDTQMDTVYGSVLQKMKEESLLEEKDNKIFLTGKGLDVSNYVMAEFLID